MVLKMKKTLYYLHQNPCAFCKYLTNKIYKCGMNQSKLHTCILLYKVHFYLIRRLFYFGGNGKKYIEELYHILQSEEVDLEEESGAAGLLGFKMVWG